MLFDIWRITPKKRTVRLRHKKGILFSNPSFLNKVFFYMGSWIVLMSLVSFVYLYYPVGNAYVHYVLTMKLQPSQQQQAHLAAADKQIAQEVVSKNYYVIKIPKLYAYAQIQENVSPFDSIEYNKVLASDKIAMSNTSTFPGSGRGSMTYLFAHSSEESIGLSRKNPIFYLLGELTTGDSIWVERNGIKYFYKVYNKKIISAEDTKYLYYSDPTNEDLILQTCWPVGTDWNRLLVFAHLMAY